jgi:hypothetical protein
MRWSSILERKKVMSPSFEGAFDAGVADEGDKGGDVGGVHVAEAVGGVGDA